MREDTENNGLDLKELGRQIRALRQERGMTQEKLAELSSRCPGFLSKIERGCVRTSTDTLTRIAAALGTTTDRLLCGVQPADPAAFYPELQSLLEDCSMQERRIILNVAQALKQNLKD